MASPTPRGSAKSDGNKTSDGGPVPFTSALNVTGEIRSDPSRLSPRLQESINGDDTSDAPEHQDTDSDEDDLAGFDDTECGRADGGVTGSEADAGAL